MTHYVSGNVEVDLEATCEKCDSDLVCIECDGLPEGTVTWGKIMTAVESLSDVDVKRRLLQSLYELHKWDKESLVDGLNFVEER
mgnify:FL=1